MLSIGSYAFNDNNLPQVSISNSVEYIGNGAFFNNYLYNIKISDNNQLQTVGDSAFACMDIPEDSKGYQIIYDINPDAIGNRCGI